MDPRRKEWGKKEMGAVKMVDNKNRSQEKWLE